jgi:hypothetical protein
VGSSPTRRISQLTHPPREVAVALQLADRGLTATEIARRTGIPRRTIHDWIEGAVPGKQALNAACIRCAGVRPVFPDATEHAYAYLLGMYLGDGTISAHPRNVYRLRIFQFSGYPRLVEESRPQ